MSHAKQLRTQRSLDAYVENIHRPSPPGNGKVEVGQHGQEMVSATVQGVLEQTIEEALMTSWGCEGSAHFSWGRWPEQTQSGTYCRALRT